jgi:hypothetical protein
MDARFSLPSLHESAYSRRVAGSNATPSTTNPQAFAKNFRLSLFVIVRELLFGIIWFE